MVLIGFSSLSEVIRTFLVIALVDLMGVQEWWSCFGYDVYELLHMFVDIITWWESSLDYVHNYIDMDVDLTRLSIVGLVMYMVWT